MFCWLSGHFELLCKDGTIGIEIWFIHALLWYVGYVGNQFNVLIIKDVIRIMNKETVYYMSPGWPNCEIWWKDTLFIRHSIVMLDDGFLLF